MGVVCGKKYMYNTAVQNFTLGCFELIMKYSVLIDNQKILYIIARNNFKMKTVTLILDNNVTDTLGWYG